MMAGPASRRPRAHLRPAGAQPLATTRALLGLEGPEPTATPTGQGDADETVVPLGPGVDLLNYRLVQDKYDNIRLFGEVRNTGAEAIPSPRMRFTLYDVDGNVVGSLDAVGVLPVVGPSETPPRTSSCARRSAGLEAWGVEEEDRGKRRLSAVFGF